jgi:DNA-binding PadR family transcriptional regulator
MRHHFFDRLHRCGEELHEAFATGRHRHGGFGHFAAGFMGAPGLGGHGFRTGRKFAAADLQLVLLSLLATRPSHGYELIKALEERSGGFYTPSPGVVYPALTYLEEIGYASVAAEGSKKLDSITDAGREYLEQHRDAAQAMLDQLEQIGRKMGRVREVFSGFDDDIGDDEGASRESRDVWHARRALKQALREKRHASGEERTRIAEILRRAAAEISHKS